MSKTARVQEALTAGQEFTPNQGAYRFGFSSTKSLTNTISNLRKTGMNVLFVPRTNSFGEVHNKYTLRAKARRRTAR